MRKPDEIKEGLKKYPALFGYEAREYIQQLEEEKAALIEALRTDDKDCEFCKHAKVYGQACEDADFMCSECKVLEQCPCYKCTSQDKHWEWCGLPEHAGGEEHESPEM